MKQMLFKIVDMTWRVLVVAIGYTLGLVLAGMILGMVGLLQADPNQTIDTTAVFQQMFVGGLVMGLMLGLVARRLPASPIRHVVVWSVLLFANIGSVIIEGYFFVPDLVTNVWVTVAQQLLPCLITAVLVYWLFAPRPAETPARTVHHRWYAWGWRFVLSACTYLAAYWLFGSINFALVTRPYYEALGSPLAVPAPQVTMQAELIRAVLIVLSVLPFLLTAQMPSRRLALWSGMLLFVIGGIVPLTWQMGSLPLPLLLASGLEIFCQNFTTGFVAALLLAGGTAVSPEPHLH
ncbi:MAG: hypothetical protein IAF02_28735, partial [Anaerolineae bacterium]|nr:hypothetical protein [Anaerolineae bacterium]